MKKVLLVVLTCVFVMAAFVGCTTPQNEESEAEVIGGADGPTDITVSDEEDTSLDDIVAKGELILGMDDSFPPMGFKDDSGELVGFDVDLATEVCSRLGVELKLQPIDWKAKELELNNGNIDVIWNGFTITEERIANLLMSEPYMTNEQIVVVLEDSDIQALADLEGKNVAVQDGSSAQDALAAQGDLIDKINQVDFKDNVTALMDVSSGQVDALAVDSVVANYYLTMQEGKYRILDETLAPEEYGIGFRKGDEALCAAVEQALDEMREDGTFDEISSKWFG